MEEAGATPGRTLDFTLRSVDFIPQRTRGAAIATRRCFQVCGLGHASIARLPVRKAFRERHGGGEKRWGL